MTPFGLRAKSRRAAVVSLKWLAEALREETVLDDVVTTAAAEPMAPTLEPTPEPAPAPAPRAATDVDDDDVDAILMAGSAVSGDVSSIMAARVAEAREQASGAIDTGADVDRDAVIEVLHTIFDPEIPVDIYELGLIYDVDVRDDRSVGVRMTLTSPNCPAAQSLPDEVKWKVSGVDGVTRADVDVVFDPPWTPELMSEEARLELNV